MRNLRNVRNVGNVLATQSPIQTLRVPSPTAVFPGRQAHMNISRRNPSGHEHRGQLRYEEVDVTILPSKHQVLERGQVTRLVLRG